VHLEAQRLPGSDAADLFATVKHAAGELGLIVHEVWRTATMAICISICTLV